jgi:hypothetical protein
MKSEFRKRLEKGFSDNMQETNDSKKADTTDAYASPGTARNVCFLTNNGVAKSLNYSFLVSIEYNPEEGMIILVFTSDTVTIKGTDLESTFWAFMDHIPRKVSCFEQRYQSILDDHSNFSISEISIVGNT